MYTRECMNRTKANIMQRDSEARTRQVSRYFSIKVFFFFFFKWYINNLINLKFEKYRFIQY